VARNATKIGIIMLVAWIIPVAGLVLALLGLTMALLAPGQERSDLRKAGIFLNSLGLTLSLLNLGVSLYLVLSGEFNPFIMLEQLSQL
jgi:hypothetical protein